MEWMRRLWWAIAFAACGDVQKVPDAAVPDAYQPDAAMELTCASGETVCNNTCTDLMTDEFYCGNCNTQCAPTQGCVAGTCVPRNTSCTRVREVDPDAPDGVYENPNNGDVFYCDFTNGKTIDGLYMGQYNATYTGYAPITFEQLSKPEFQALFIGLYNRQGGLRLIATWDSDNCCFAMAADQRWAFGGSYLFPALGSGSACNPTGGYTGGPYWLLQGVTQTLLTPPLPDDFFVTDPASQTMICSNGANPGMFWKVRDSLN